MAGVIKRDVRDSKPDCGPTRWPGRPRASVPYVLNLRMDPAEKMDPHSHEWGYVGRKFVASKLWAPAATGQFLGAHLKSLHEYPPRQAADTLSMKKAIEAAMAKMENPHSSSN